MAQGHPSHRYATLYAIDQIQQCNIKPCGHRQSFAPQRHVAFTPLLPFPQWRGLMHTATKSEHTEDHHHVQSIAPATKSAHGRKSCSDLLRLSRKVNFGPLRLSRKAITKSQSAHGAATNAQSGRAPARPTRFCAQSKCTIGHPALIPLPFGEKGDKLSLAY